MFRSGQGVERSLDAANTRVRATVFVSLTDGLRDEQPKKKLNGSNSRLAGSRYTESAGTWLASYGEQVAGKELEITE
jgi:hypothetical protein